MNTEIVATGSYQQYKKDTSVFIAWLTQAARACGYITRASRLPNDQSDAHTPTTATRFGYPIREILAQAEVVSVSGSPKLRAPDNILKLARRAIATRKQVTAKFSASSSNAGANESHRFFTGVLEEAVEMLQRRSVQIITNTWLSSPFLLVDFVSYSR